MPETQRWGKHSPAAVATQAGKPVTITQWVTGLWRRARPYSPGAGGSQNSLRGAGDVCVLERLRLALKQGKRRVLSVVAALWGLKQVLGWF